MTHPLREYRLQDLQTGQREAFEIAITQPMVDDFVRLTGDDNPLHTDAEYCRGLGHRSVVVHGCLTSAFVSTLIGKYLPGRHARLLSLEVDWRKPVFVGDTLTYEGTVSDVSEATRAITVAIIVRNQAGVKVASGKALSGVLQ